MTALAHRAPIATPAPTVVDERLRWRLRHAASCLLLTALAFNSDAGRIVADTKIDLTTDPVRFLTRALHLWDQVGFSGQVQNQAYGYLFPIGPFFALGHLAALPAWVVQRLWWSVVLVTAYTGVVALARRLDIGTPLTGLAGGLAYATSPHLLTVLGPVSAEAWPMALAPWAVVPLVDAARGGSLRRGAARSAVAVALMGGANATLVLAAVLPAALYLLTRAGGPQRRRLLAWWTGAVVLATAWWVVPLLLLGRYSPPFLDYIESASITTSPTSLFEVLRGTSDWVAYLQADGWQAGWLVLTTPAIVLMSSVLVALGLAGLTRRAMPESRWLVTCLLVGVAVLTAGHMSALHGLWAGDIRTALDGFAAPLRNVHKFDVVIRLPLVLGLTHLLATLRFGGAVSPRRIAAVVTAVASVCALGATAAPLITRGLAPARSYESVPAYWSAAASWLHAHGQGGRRALLAPPSHGEDYLWGTLTDNPLQPLASSPWTERNSVPLVPVAGIRMLDAVTTRLENGTPSPGLAPYLLAGGIGYVVVRNDLEPGDTDNVRPVLVRAALAGSPGLALVARFGPSVGSAGDTLVVDQNLRRPVQAVEIWRVGPAAGAVELRARAVPMSSVPVVTGGPESVLDAAQAGLPTTGVLAGDVPAGDVPAGGPSRAGLGGAVITDELRRRETNFGLVTGNTSATLTANAAPVFDRRADDYRLFGGHHDAVARFLGAADVTASSSMADANVPDADPSRQPYAAVDGDPATWWQPSPFVPLIGQHLDIDLGHSLAVRRAAIRLAAGSPPVTVDVRTGAGIVRTALEPGRMQAVGVRPGDTRYLEVTVVATGNGGAGGQFGIAELAVPGMHIAKTVVVPADQRRGTPVDAVAFTAAPGARNGCIPYQADDLCAAGLARQGEDDAALDRSYTLPSSGRFAVTATVTPRPGPDLDRLLARIQQPAVSARASSQAVPDPAAGPGAAVDGDLRTGWIASATEIAPTLSLRWAQPQTISSVTLRTGALLAATRPFAVEIQAGAAVRNAVVSTAGLVRFRALTTNTITITLRAFGLVSSVGPNPGSLVPLGLGVSEVEIPGVTPAPATDSSTTPVRLLCGELPAISIDGHRTDLQATTTVAALRRVQPIAAQPCGDVPVVQQPGNHRLLARSTSAWRVTSVLLRSTAPATSRPVAPQVEVRRWQSTSRTVHVAARAVPTLLVISENSNPGWHATANGIRLPAITVNGWEQGYELPAGAAVEVGLDFAPDQPYRIALGLGLLLVLVLFLLAWRPARRRPAGVRLHPAHHPLGLAAVALPAAALVGGAVGIVVVAVALAAGRFVPGLRAGRRIDLVWGLVATGAVLTAGVALAAQPYPRAGYPANDLWVQVSYLLALAAVVGSAVRGPAREPAADLGGPSAAGAQDAWPVPRRSGRSRRR